MCMCACKEHQLKGNAQYSLPPYTSKFGSAAFDIENIIYFLTKQASQMRRSTVLSLPLQLVFPGACICLYACACVCMGVCVWVCVYGCVCMGVCVYEQGLASSE
jgi:hypothetical protein